jgi:hypothetical protein
VFSVKKKLLLKRRLVDVIPAHTVTMIVDKERSNFCDYYLPRGAEKKPKGNLNRTQEAKEALEALFKKK